MNNFYSGLFALLALSACTPEPDASPATVQMEARLRTLEEAGQQRAGGPQMSYTFAMAEDPVSVAMADWGELPVLVSIADVTTTGDSQSVRLVVRNPHSLRLTGLKLNVAWSSGDAESERREIEWTGVADPGFATEVVFRVGPVAAENLRSVTISEVRSRWAGRRVP